MTFEPTPIFVSVAGFVTSGMAVINAFFIRGLIKQIELSSTLVIELKGTTYSLTKQVERYIGITEHLTKEMGKLASDVGILKYEVFHRRRKANGDGRHTEQE